MKLEIPRSQEKKLSKLDKSIRERIKKKLNEIENKVDDLGLDPKKVIEKPLRGKLSGRWQQGVGGLYALVQN
ncbi:MAG: hypothetical protein BTN85_1842 [Candidatus Methanohalarchaeum thermophilum]|uniref:Uncharacterized protein n=1 Tax=Methanohalarchaeum thermophilum TaxID=1903181 RepID=A0A1Q6DS43_METT1|nr:MAG: hypothetical protein BTN85_1842 [Candidatus Methanohalarchaeum thermophilum]